MAEFSKKRIGKTGNALLEIQLNKNITFEVTVKRLSILSGSERAVQSVTMLSNIFRAVFVYACQISSPSK